MLTFTKAFGTIFLGTPKAQQSQQPGEVSFLMLLPLYFIILIMLFIGIVPQLILAPIYSIIQRCEPGIHLVPVPFIAETLMWAGRTSLLLIALVLLLLMIRKRFTRRKPMG